MPALVDLTVRDFTERLSQRTPTPGGGSVAACLAGFGAGLAAMAFRFTAGEKYAAVERAMAQRVEDLDRLRSRAVELVDRDSAAYDGVTTAYKLPKSTEEERKKRGDAVEAALRGAMEVPLETLRTALAALEVAAAGAADVNPNLGSDCATGAWCLWSAAEGAALNVRINAGSLKDRALAESRLAECESMRQRATTLAGQARDAAAGRIQ